MISIHSFKGLSIVVALCLLASCSKNKVTVTGVGDRDAEGFQVVMPGKDVNDPTHGKELWLGVGPISAVEGSSASGVAQVHVMADGVSLVTLQANIYPAPKGQELRGWLLNDDGERIDLGTLDPIMNDVRHSLNYEEGSDLRTFTNVEITLQSIGSKSPGTLQATGTITPRTRQ